MSHPLVPDDLLRVPDGAHVAVYLGDDTVVHLAHRHGTPRIESVATLLDHPAHAVLLGAKRVRTA